MFRVQVDVKTQGQADVLADYINYFIQTSAQRGISIPDVLVIPLDDEEE